MLERRAGGYRGGEGFHASSTSAAAFEARSEELEQRPAVVVASEPLDEDPGWSELASGELVHVDGDLRVSRTVVLPDPPRHRLTLDDLLPAAAASQTAHLAAP